MLEHDANELALNIGETTLGHRGLGGFGGFGRLGGGRHVGLL